MIKAVLLDLDDTLITTHTEVFFPDYLKLLAERIGAIMPMEMLAPALTASVEAMLTNLAPLTTSEEAFWRAFFAKVDHPREEILSAFQAFYAQDFPQLQPRIMPRAHTRHLLGWLFDNDHLVVVATNPVTPETAIYQRMAWGQIDMERYPFALVTTLETMHFAKPNPEYFEEILARIGVRPEEALMVGNDWEEDIVCAAAAGLNTFWVTDGQTASHDGRVGTDGWGTLETLLDLVRSGWLETLAPRPTTRIALMRRLAAMPAAIDALLREHPREVIEQCPCEGEWSVQGVIAHLRCHELREDRPWLEHILEEDNPFISATVSTSTRAPQPGDPHEELWEFAQMRAETVSWLKGLPNEQWARPARHSIFGPTYFEEMVAFMTEHDRVHLRQMRVAIEEVYKSRAAKGKR